MMHPKVAEIVRNRLGLSDAWQIGEVRSMLAEVAPGLDLDDTELEVLWRDHSEKSSAGWLEPSEDELRVFVSSYDLRDAPGMRMG